MRMFSWIHSKRNGCKHVSKKHGLISSPNYYLQKELPAAGCREEFIDWPHNGHGLLAIGTIGNTNLKKITEKTNLDENPEEEGKLQNHLDLLFNEAFGQPEAPDFSLDKFVRQSNDNDDDDDDDDDAVHSVDSSNKDDHHVQRSTSSVYNINRGKDICFDNRGTAISKKTLSFLLKKVFACTSDQFAPPPSLKDPLSESRLEKMLRAILHNKIYPQSSTSSTTLSAKKKCLENRHEPKSANEDDENHKGENGSKWVKTDSECAARGLA
ncbi:hypothetical protein Dsin_018071 [Dipteronia sinensis]|uniref:Uncharacterized protein n=1 Tax=Dipteronia sinensis TaxID=43782 RepID=A0AAE0E7K5_9ROSI|nr:hypothetical protein Dsin_018071 [Dipteronia sinensis]